MRKILIANRGEIAVRIIRACRNLGIRSVAIYGEEDAESFHVQLADQRICVGVGRAAYLNKEQIITAAQNFGADGIHPGYGFLSENADFARLCGENDLIFIGPSSEVIGRMGNKSEARKTMKKAGVPIVPGSEGAVFDAKIGLAEAKEIGFPVIIKASSGGGGKGMRIAKSEDAFIAQFNIAQTEAANGFGDEAMYIERYVEKPKHVEIQIMADVHGNVVSLGERDCSVQRNHQKLIEEAPSPAITREIAHRMSHDAVQAAIAVGYVNAGTIEFIVDAKGNYYFMEMNTRIQVEHGVTEMVTGMDLVMEQIRVARGARLSFNQDDIKLVGHAIECRINAEIPEKNFMPAPGKVKGLHLPAGTGVRVDTGLYTGYEVPSEFDSMIAKILVHAPTRDEAIRKMRTALEETLIMGVETNIDFQYQIFRNPVFIEGIADTGFVGQMLNLDPDIGRLREYVE